MESSLPVQFHLERTNLGPEHQNQVSYISVRLKDFASLIGRPISEVRQAPNWGQVIHVVADASLQKYFQCFHRYGPRSQTASDCPYQAGRVRALFVSLVGEHNLATTFQEESVMQRKVLQNFFCYSKLETLKALFIAITGDWLSKQLQFQSVPLFDASLHLVGRCLIEGVLGYTDCTPEDVDANVNFFKSLFHPSPNERAPLSEQFKNSSPGLFTQFCNFLTGASHLINQGWVFLVEGNKIDALTERIYYHTLLKENSLVFYLKAQGFAEKQILESIKGFLLAGQETVGYLLGFMLYEYARQVNMQEEHAHHPQKIKQAYLEALRLYSVAGTLREAGADFKLTYTVNGMLQEHYIRQGDLINCTPYLSGQDPSLWEDPQCFNPQRENLESIKQIPHFGSGPHRCIGEKLAQMEITTILARILSQARLQTSEELPDLLASFTIRPLTDIQVSFTACPAKIL